MAIGTAFVATSMPDLDVWFGTIETTTSTTIVISDGVRQATYTGNFIYASLGGVFGTLQGISEYRDGTLQYSLTDINASANAMFNAIQTLGDFDLAASIALSQADTLTGSGGADTIRSYAGDDMLYGGAGLDRLYGEAGNDKLRGGTGQDELYGGNGRDRLWGEGDNDALNGGKGRDTLKGGKGSDTLKGGAGDDRLLGGKGGDTLTGGKGNDMMTGGLGNDRFVFSAGLDGITDFNVASNKEKVDLSGVAAITGFKDLRNNFLTEVAGNVVIDDGGGNTLTLLGLAIGDLDKGDFIF